MPGAGRRRARGSRRRAPSRTAMPRLGGRAQVRARARPPRAATGDGPVEHARERLDEQVVVLAVAHRDADRRRRTRARRGPGAAARRRARAPSSTGTKRKFACDGSGSSPSARSARREPLALLDHRRRRRAATASAASASAAESVETGAGAWRAFSSAASSRDGERVADARARERERLRERAQHDRRRRRAAARAVSPQYSKYASSTTSGRASGSGLELAGRVVRAAGERRATGLVVADLGARRAARRCGRADRSAPRGIAIVSPGPGERARAEQDQVVGAGAEHDVLGLDAVVVGDRARAARGSRRRG